MTAFVIFLIIIAILKFINVILRLKKTIQISKKKDNFP